MRLKPVRSAIVEPSCLLPENFTGEWINTANIDADVFINSTHIVETWHPDVSRWRKAVYICKEQRDSRYMMARLTIDGWWVESTIIYNKYAWPRNVCVSFSSQVDYQCFDFLPRHHNVIRFRKGVAMIMNDFHTVCSWVQFKNDVEWKYDLMLSKLNCSNNHCCISIVWCLLGKDPVPIRCPVAGAYRFSQEGDFLFQTRILGGITKDPRPDVWSRTGQFSCKKNISRLAVCDTDQKEITIDETYCWSTDHLGRPIDIYSDPDYRMQCIGYWKENLKSYLITYDQLDAFTKYRCWVRSTTTSNSKWPWQFCLHLNLSLGVSKGRLEQSLDVHVCGTILRPCTGCWQRQLDSGSSCKPCHGWKWTRMWVHYYSYLICTIKPHPILALYITAGGCPMYFNDGSDPWVIEEKNISVFNFSDYSGGANL